MSSNQDSKKVFSNVQDPFLRYELRRMNNVSKVLITLNILLVFVPMNVLYWVVPSFLISTWTRLGLSLLGLVFSALIFSQARNHPTIHGFANSTHLYNASLLFLSLLAYAIYLSTRVFVDAGLNLAMLGIFPTVFSVVHVICFSVQCSENWVFARDVATGNAQWTTFMNKQIYTQTAFATPAPSLAQPQQPVLTYQSSSSGSSYGAQQQTPIQMQQHDQIQSQQPQQQPVYSVPSVVTAEPDTKN